jgi:transposase, IS5 family
MSFADLELLRQGMRLAPLLQAICDFLDKQPALIERVRRDLVRGLKKPDKGRRGLTALPVLRALVLMRLSVRLKSSGVIGISCVSREAA